MEFLRIEVCERIQTQHTAPVEFVFRVSQISFVAELALRSRANWANTLSRDHPNGLPTSREGPTLSPRNWSEVTTLSCPCLCLYVGSMVRRVSTDAIFV